MTEHTPTVVFDIEVGKHVDFIDFDYQEFSDMAEEANLSPEQVDAFTVHFSAKDIMVATGRFMRREKTARVYVPAITGRAQSNGHNIHDLINLTAIHETGHYVDHENHTGDRTLRNFQLGRYSLLGGSLASIGLAVAENNPLYAVGGLALIAGTGYMDHRRYPMPNMRPTERFAYSFEYSNEHYQLVTIVPKTKSLTDQSVVDS